MTGILDGSVYFTSINVHEHHELLENMTGQVDKKSLQTQSIMMKTAFMA